jgi:hypothetical protein
MRGVEITAGALGAIALVGSLGTATPAHASNYGVELNGTYRVTSNGDWAKTNDVFIDERTVVQTWTMSSSCTSPQRCEGQVTSDQGWTAPLRLGGGEGSPNAVGDFWVVDHVISNWEPCPDGTAATGNQKFIFWGMDPLTNQRNMTRVDLLSGVDKTKAPSGACGINKPLVIELPVRLDKVA